MGGVNGGPEQYPGWGQTEDSSRAYMPEFRPVPPHADYGAEQAVPALSPIPPIEEPTAVFVARADTARLLAGAVAQQTNRNLAPLLGVAWIVSLGVLWWTIGGVVSIFAAFGFVMSGVVGRAIWYVPSVRRMTRTFAKYAAAGQTLATRFGPDFFEIRTDAYHSRIFYSQLTSLAVRGEFVVVAHGVLTAYPRELFPDYAIGSIRAANPKLLNQQ